MLPRKPDWEAHGKQAADIHAPLAQGSPFICGREVADGRAVFGRRTKTGRGKRETAKLTASIPSIGSISAFGAVGRWNSLRRRCPFSSSSKRLACDMQPTYEVPRSSVTRE